MYLNFSSRPSTRSLRMFAMVLSSKLWPSLAKPTLSGFNKLKTKMQRWTFNLLMKFQTQSRKSWMDVFPPNDLLHKDRDADAPALVDIGGATGADVLQFRRRYPDVAGQIILQDLPAVINSAKARNTDSTTLGIECQAYDLFQRPSGSAAPASISYAPSCTIRMRARFSATSCPQ